MVPVVFRLSWVMCRLASLGLVPLIIVGLPVGYGGAGGLYPVGGVVLLVGFAKVTNEPDVVSQRCTTFAFGQGSYAVFLGA